MVISDVDQRRIIVEGEQELARLKDIAESNKQIFDYHKITGDIYLVTLTSTKAGDFAWGKGGNPFYGLAMEMSEKIMGTINRELNKPLDIIIKPDTKEIEKTLEKGTESKEQPKTPQGTLIIQSQYKLSNDCIKAEEKRLGDITGMKVCILNAGYSVVAVNNG